MSLDFEVHWVSHTLFVVYGQLNLLLTYLEGTSFVQGREVYQKKDTLIFHSFKCIVFNTFSFNSVLYLGLDFIRGLIVPRQMFSHRRQGVLNGTLLPSRSEGQLQTTLLCKYTSICFEVLNRFE